MAFDLTNLSNVISDIRKQDLYYIGNLKRTKAVKALTHHHFVLPGCGKWEISCPWISKNKNIAFTADVFPSYDNAFPWYFGNDLK